MTNPIKLAVIGHTNVGKTSLLRTLTRNDSFGEVKNASATTRHVEKVLIGNDKQSLVALYDTPGLEDATGIMDYVSEHTNARDDGVTRLNAFLTAFEHQSHLSDFSQEVKVIKAVLNADIALYVIDARKQPTAKYQDELAILAMSGVPILPVFNFVKDCQIDRWQTTLSRRAIHVFNYFDTVAFDFDSEIKLWQNLATLSKNPDNFQTLIKHRTDIWYKLLEDGCDIISDFLINVASFVVKSNDDNPQNERILQRMHDSVKKAFGFTCQKLLILYQFYNQAIDVDNLYISIDKIDVFDKSLLPEQSIKTLGGAGIGAVIGTGIDVMSFGASLGIGTAIGSLVGGGGVNYTSIKDKISGIKYHRIDDTAINAMAGYLVNLHNTLRHTGHAKIGQFDKMTTHFLWQQTPKSIIKARQKPHLSDLTITDSTAKNHQTLRQDLADKLVVEILL